MPDARDRRCERSYSISQPGHVGEARLLRVVSLLEDGFERRQRLPPGHARTEVEDSGAHLSAPLSSRAPRASRVDVRASRAANQFGFDSIEPVLIIQHLKWIRRDEDSDLAAIDVFLQPA